MIQIHAARARRRRPQNQQNSIKMTPAETARALFYFSAHTRARPAPITTDANHMAVPHARE